MRSNRNTVRDTVGYLTAKVEGLDEFLKSHMEKEEEKFATIDKNTCRMYKLLGAMLVMNLLVASGYSIRDLIQIALQVM